MNHVSFTEHYLNTRNRVLFRWVDVQKRAAITRAFEDCAGQRLEVLDLGCGAGAVTSVLLPQHELHGVDVDRALLAVAESRGLKTAVGEFDRVPYGDATFDAVCMVDSIEHVPSREKTAREIRRVLKPGGKLVLITPAYNNPLWVVGEKVALALSSKEVSGHTSPFTLESLQFFLSTYFELERITRLNLGMWVCGVGRNRV